MSKKLNRATWRTERLRDCCAICLTNGRLVVEAYKCDGVHFHEYCGATIKASKGGLTCAAKHAEETIPGYIVKTRREAVQSGIKW